MKSNDFTKKKTRRKAGIRRSDRAETRRPLDDTTGKLDSTDRDNDPNWYFTNPDIARQVSSISFSQYLGVDTKVRAYVNNDDGTSQTLKLNVPSIMVLNANPSPGISVSSATGTSLAMRKLYSLLSSQNAKTTAYAPQDLGMLMLQLGEVISVMEHIRRAFGVAFTYSQRNRTLPRELLSAMGFNPDDFLANLANHRIEFNTFVTSINRIPFLSNVSYYYKCADMYQRVYTDSTSEMAQVILMRPYSTWILDEAYNDKGSGLRTTNLPAAFATTGNDWVDWVDVLNKMINALFSSATFNYIYSDVLNFANKSGTKLFFLDYLLEGYTVIPEYNENFLLQVHNCTLTGVPYKPTTGGISDLNDVTSDVDRNILKYSPMFKVPNSAIKCMVPTVVDFNMPDPKTEDIIEATRFVSVMGTSTFHDTDTNKTRLRYAVTLPDHYIVELVVHANGVNVSGTTLQCSTGTTAKDRKWFRDFTSRLSVFDWAPVVYGFDAEDTTNLTLYTYGDLNYYVDLGPSWFDKVNDLTYLALFELR